METTSAQAQTRVSAGFEYGIVGETTNNAHQPERGVLLSTLGISQVVISQLSNNGQFGGTQGNDYDVDVTISFTNGTVATFPAAVNWRDTSGSTVNGIGLIRPDGSAADGSGYTPRSGYSTSYLLRFVNQSVTYSETNAGVRIPEISGNAATSGLLDALNAYVTDSPPSTTPSVLTTTLTANPTSIAADGTATSTITVQVKDVNGNNITTGGQTITLTRNLGTLSTVTDNGDGTYTATLTSSTTAGTATISGTLAGTAITDTETVAFTTGAADVATSTITASPTGIAADGTTTSTITVQLKDSNGNNLTTSGGTVVLTRNLGTLSTVTDNGDGTYTATLTSSTTAGTATISGTLAGTAITDTETVAFTTGAADVATSTITASPTGIAADGTTTSTITVQLKDSNGNNLTTSGGTVVLTRNLGTLSTVTDNGDGTYTATLTSSTTAGTATISGTLAGTAITDTETVAFTTGAADVATSTITASPTGIAADGTTTSTITVQLKDSNGNNLTTSGGTVVLTRNLGTLSTVTDNGDGTYTATLTSSTTAGTATISGTLAGTAITDTETVAFTTGAADVATSTITASPTGIAADGTTTSTITVQLKDSNGNNLTTSGGTVVLTRNLGTLSTVTDNGDGTYTATLTSSTTAGTATISGTLAGTAITDTETVAFTTGAADVATSTITASPTGIAADGTTTSTITVQLKDSNGNNLTTSGGTVVLTRNLGTLSTVTDNGDGTYTATLTSSTTAGTATISGTLAGTAITDTETVDFLFINTAPVANAGPDETVASSASVTLDGSGSRDADGNILTYAWSQTSGTSVTISNNTAIQPTFTVPTLAVGDADAVLVFSLTVNDGTVSSSADTVTITVEAHSPTPATDFAEYEEDNRATLVDNARRNLTSAMSVNQRLIHDARSRMIETLQAPSRCTVDENLNDAGVNNELDTFECTPSSVSTRNDVPFDVDGGFELSGSTLSTSGSFFEQTGHYEGTQRRLFFGDFDVLHDGDTGSTTATLTARVAWEEMTSDSTMLGYFIGSELAHSNIDGAFEGDQDSLGLSFGGYTVHKLDDQLFLDGFLTFGAGSNNLDMANDVLALTSDYTTRTVTFGAALSGVYDYEQYEFRPELAFSYGKTWIGDVGFTGRAYGLVDETLSLDAGDVSITNLTLRPEIVWALDAETVADSNTQLSFAPRFICQRTSAVATTQDCGAGAEIGLSSTSEDGLSSANIRLVMDRLGNSKRSSFALNFERSF